MRGPRHTDRGSSQLQAPPKSSLQVYPTRVMSYLALDIPGLTSTVLSQGIGSGLVKKLQSSSSEKNEPTEHNHTRYIYKRHT